MISKELVYTLYEFAAKNDELVNLGRMINVCDRNGFDTVEQLKSATYEDIRICRNVGEHTAINLKKACGSWLN